jgi:predicted TIM-barrel fold metal-dependent hydrolase
VIVDAHTHLLPGRLAEKVRAFFDAHMTGELVYPLDHRRVLDLLAADGVHSVWNLPYAHKAGIASGLNASTADTTQRLADHAVAVITGCTTHPDEARPTDVVAEAVERHGARVVKLHCSVGAFRADDRRLDGVWAYAAEQRLPVVVHAGHAVSGHTGADDLSPISVVADRHPSTTIVIAHTGHHAHEQALALLDVHANLYADLTPVVTELVPIAAAAARRFADRLLFGSDAPNTGCITSQLVAHVDALGLTQDQRAQILGGNAERLIAGG